MHCWCLLIQMCPLDLFRWADYKDCFVLSNFLLCVYLCTCVCVCVCHSVLMETEDNCLELVLFYCVRWGDWTEVLNLGSKYLYPLSQLTVSHHAWLLIIVCMCVSVGVNMTWHMVRRWGQLSGVCHFCPAWVLWIELGSSGLCGKWVYLLSHLDDPTVLWFHLGSCLPGICVPPVSACQVLAL